MWWEGILDLQLVNNHQTMPPLQLAKEGHDITDFGQRHLSCSAGSPMISVISQPLLPTPNTWDFLQRRKWTPRPASN